MKQPAQVQGFTLLEALVTIVIVSIGLLGLLGLQTVSIVNTQVSASRTQATFAADNIADRMRANRAGVDSNAYDGLNHQSANGSKPNCENGNSCSPAQMARYDAFVWDEALGSSQAGLPQGQGAIACIETAVTGSGCVRYRVTISWQERQPDQTSGTGTPTTQSFETVVQP